MALLWVAVRQWIGWVSAVTVDHGFRPESAAEAAMVARVCAGLGVAHATLAWTGVKPRVNRAAAARHARYALMAAWCRAEGIVWLLTAHHADDQAETLLMRLARGAGVAGLSGIRAMRPLGGGVAVARPLLAARKADLVALCEAESLAFIDDPTNRDPAYDRTAARALLAATPWLRAERLAASAAHLADLEAALAWAAERAWAGRASTKNGATIADADDLPRALRVRLLARALATVKPASAPRGPDLARLLATLDAGTPATLAGVRVEPGPPWRFTAETRGS